MSLGGLAVCIFFVLSGYLITGSFERQSPARFLLARALRLLPALVVVLIVLTFFVGPILTNLPLRLYFHSEEIYRYLATDVSLLSFRNQLPGVFAISPYGHAIDGSLWTLRYEARCYLLVFILGIFGLLNRYVIATLLAAALVCSWRYIGGVSVDFYSCFLAGAALYKWDLPLRGSLALGCGLLWAASLWHGFHIGTATVGAYVILYFGLSPSIRLPKVTRWGDLSYGVYVWAFPIQQIVTLALGRFASWYLNLAISVPVVIALACLSWRFVEGPALTLKGRSQSNPALVSARSVS